MLSVEIGEYYQQKRHIPDTNMIRISFEPGITVMPPELFESIKHQVDRQTPERVQGLVLTWAAPYRVDRMSITSAFAFGYDPNFSVRGCKPTPPNPYFNQTTLKPYQKFQMRPTMMLAAENFTEAKQLIDRGVLADASFPKGTAYLLSTKDRARNVRAAGFGTVRQRFASYFSVEVLQTNTLEDRQDVMFYFTGLARVKGLDTLNFLPGAIADHLTSGGGQLTDSKQMSSLRWLEAGATGSYGTVVEPCAFTQKFPDVGIVMQSYLDGATLLESYWRSVEWPGQGVFIGEPLARPFGNPS